MVKAMDDSTASSLAVFRDLDGNKDGSLTIDELRKAYETAATVGVNTTANSTADSTLDASEVTEENPGYSQDPGHEYLLLADTNGDSHITFDEFSHTSIDKSNSVNSSNSFVDITGNETIEERR